MNDLVDDKPYIEYLIKAVRQYIVMGYNLPSICGALSENYSIDDIFLAYNAALILNKDMYGVLSG